MKKNKTNIFSKKSNNNNSTSSPQLVDIVHQTLNVVRKQGKNDTMCDYCFTKGHNKKTCLAYRNDKLIARSNNIKWKEILEENFINAGMGIGSLIRIIDENGYDYIIVTDIDWNSLHWGRRYPRSIVGMSCLKQKIGCYHLPDCIIKQLPKFSTARLADVKLISSAEEPFIPPISWRAGDDSIIDSWLEEESRREWFNLYDDS